MQVKHLYMACALSLGATAALAEPLPPEPAPPEPAPAPAPPERAVPEPVETLVTTGDRVGGGQSATYTDTPWIELAQSVQRLDAETMEDWGVQSLHEAWQFVAGVSPADQNVYSRYGGLAKMRGLNGSQTLLEGFTLPQRLSTFYDVVALSAIDVLRGPADALNGGQTPSGTQGGFGGEINLRARRPTDEADLRVALSGRTLGNDELRLAINANQPLVDDTLAVRIDAAGEIGSPFYLPAGYSPETRYFIAPAVTWTPHDRVTIDARGAWLESRGYPYRGVPVIYGELLGPYDAFLGDEDSTHVYRGALAQLEVDVELADAWSAQVAASYTRTDMQYDIWHWGTARGFGIPDMYEQRQGLPALRRSDATEELIEARALTIKSFTTAWWRHTVLIGADALFRHDEGTSPPGLISETPIGLDDPITPARDTLVEATGPGAPLTDNRRERVGAMAQYQAEVGPYIRALAGARVDEHRIEDAIDDSAHDKLDLSWRAGLTVLPLPTVSVYGSYTQAASPNFGYLGADGEELTESRQFAQLEVGAKTELFERLMLGVAGFRIWTDKVPQALPEVEGQTAALYGLTGEATNTGFEITAQGEVWAGWRVFGAYTYIDIEGEEGADHDIAPHEFSLSTSLRLPGPLADVTVGGGYRFRDRRAVGYGRGATDPRHQIEAYHLFNALVAYDLPAEHIGAERWTARLNVDNLTDTRSYSVVRQPQESAALEPLAVMLTLLVDI